MLLSTARRMLYPFVVFVAAHLSTSIELLSAALALMRVTTLVGLFATPFLWSYGRRFGGPKATMIGAVVLQVLALVFISIADASWLVMALISCMGMVKGFFSPSALTLQRAVFVGASIRQRQVAATFTELNWGLASLLGVPACGALLAIDFRLPFWCIAGISCLLLPPLIAILRRVESLPINSKEKPRTNHAQIGIHDGEIDMQRARPPNSRCLPLDCPCRRLVSIMRSRRTLSNVFDQFSCALSMGIKDVTFGLWLAEVYKFDATQVAEAAIVLGLADISGEVMLTLLLLKCKILAGCMSVPTWISIALSALLFYVSGTLDTTLGSSSPSPITGLVAVYFMSTFLEMKAVQCLSVAATTDEEDLDPGLPEIAAYTATNIGFAIGTLVAPLVWSLGREIAFSGTILSIAAVAVMLKSFLIGPCVGAPPEFDKAEFQQDVEDALDADQTVLI